MARYSISVAAEADIETILTWTYQHFGKEAGLRYYALILRAILDIAADPFRSGSQERLEIATDARSYHLKHSRRRIMASQRAVKTPRHWLIYRVTSDGIVLSRVLHDQMDLGRHAID